MSADYNLAVSESIRALQEFGYKEIPIQLKKILTALRRTIKTCSYTRYSNQTGLSIDKICEYFESDLGACAYDRKKERYVIYYNDTKMNKGLTRFTIAHELGHIFLEHHQKANTDIMLRMGISERVYKNFENEANCFARNFLSPHPLVYAVTDVSSLTQHAVYDVMDAFYISFEASIARIKLLRPDGYRIRREHIAYFNQYHIRYGYFCEECKNAEINPNSFCKICGAEQSVFEKGVDRLIYGDGVKLDENMRVLKCPRCDNEEFNEKADFCKICGSKVYNYCLGEIIYDYHGNIEDTHYHKNDSNARFCETCGRETVFFENKFLQPWKEYQDYINSVFNDNDEDDDVPF